MLADDSGLEVDALRARRAFIRRDSPRWTRASRAIRRPAENNAKLLRLLDVCRRRSGQRRFRCVVALTPVSHSEPGSASPVCQAEEVELQTELFEGACEGRIVSARRAGGAAFGYDPLFIPSGHEATFAELGEEVKNRLSHRARALALLRCKFRG